MIESNWNRRAEEINLYLENVLEWNEYYGKEFRMSEIEVVPSIAFNGSKFNSTLALPTVRHIHESYSEREIRLALGLAFYDDGLIIEKPLKAVGLNETEL